MKELSAGGWLVLAIVAGFLELRAADTAASVAEADRVAVAARGTDYARAEHVEDWLRHPVYGDPSFDAFERVPGNPIHRGAPPMEWPVNGFLFRDPPTGRLYAYVGEYTVGYAARPSRCLLYRTPDGGHSWSRVGVVLEGDPGSFDKGGHTPDVSVVYDGGRYHMVYDWGELDFNAEGGLAYAWAERPEGPWHRAAEPITRNSRLPKLLGRYRRTYAATLVRRAGDWLIVGMMDAAPNSWALFAMTAARPEGPWSERVLLRHVERDEFHPPLLEFYPAFVHEGFLQVPATSVALNRNFNVLFRVPLERATEPGAMTLARHGSLWHSEDVEHEAYGLWGQTLSGTVGPDGTFWALFHSRDASGMGTANLARRAWNRPLRDRGFVLSGHQGPSVTLLRRTPRRWSLETDFDLRGSASLLWDYHGLLGPSAPRSDATLHARTGTRYRGVRWSSNRWEVVRVDAGGRAQVLGSGNVPVQRRRRVRVEPAADGGERLVVGGSVVWEGGSGAGAGGGAGGRDSRCVRVVGRVAFAFAGRTVRAGGGGRDRGGRVHLSGGRGLVGSGTASGGLGRAAIAAFSPRGRLGVPGARSAGEVERHREPVHPLEPAWTGVRGGGGSVGWASGGGGGFACGEADGVGEGLEQ